VEALNRSFREPVIATATGGKRGGGARVTPFGAEVARRFRSMEGKASKAIEKDLASLQALLRRTGR
jgi:molybdate transport system regulatory protein